MELGSSRQDGSGKRETEVRDGGKGTDLRVNWKWSLQDIETQAADGEAGQRGVSLFCVWVSGERGHH